MPYADKARQKEYQRKHYRKHKAVYGKNQIKRRAGKAAFVNEVKDVPCVDCGIPYPYWIMDLDHVRGSKKANISDLVRSGTLKDIKEEITKCEVVCANCHRERTYVRAKKRKEVRVKA